MIKDAIELVGIRMTIAAMAILLAASAAGAKQSRLALEGYPVAILYGEGGRRVAGEVGRICSEALPELSAQLGLAAVSPITIYVVGDMAGYRRSRGMNLPHWGAAFAFMREQVMLVDANKASATWDALGKTISHELSHLLAAQAVGDVPLPLWFLEGLAQWQAGEWSLVQGWRLMGSVWRGRYPSIMEISARFPKEEEAARAAYRVAYFGFVELFEGMEIERDLPRLIRLLREKGDFAQALLSLRQESPAEFSSRVAEKLHERYTSPLLVFQTGPLFSILAVLFIVVVAAVKLRARRRLRAMERLERGL